MSEGQSFTVPPGVVCITTYGQIQTETAFALLEARSCTERQGVTNIRYVQVPGALVDKARNEAARALLRDPERQWLLMVDGDMTFDPNAILRMAWTAFGSHTHFDAVGAYCNLRGEVGLPTIDTGTGSWEVWYPDSGVVEVMRTGAAFLLVKRHVFERVPDPWFALRIPMRPLDALAEVDTFCRTRFDGRNPFMGRPDRAWETLVDLASTDRSMNERPYIPAEVGEDSSFCDRMTGAGLRVAVDTGIVTRHLTKETQDWTHLRRKMDERDRDTRLLSGMTA